MSGHERDDDPDRAAILARRRRFVALALSGLASSGCKSPGPQACLDIAVPEDEGGGEQGGPIVEDPGRPVDPGTESSDDEGGEIVEPSPQPCLEFAAPPHPKPAPRPCLKKAAPSPKVCLLMMDET